MIAALVSIVSVLVYGAVGGIAYYFGCRAVHEHMDKDRFSSSYDRNLYGAIVGILAGLFWPVVLPAVLAYRWAVRNFEPVPEEARRA